MQALTTAETSQTGASDGTGQVGYWEGVSRLASEVVRILDEKEGWVIEGHPQFSETLSDLIALTKDHPAITEFALENPRDAFKLMAYLHTSTAMMLLHITEVSRPKLVERFIDAVTSLIATDSQGEVSVAAHLALDRFMAFERTSLIGRIFSKERVDGVVHAIDRASAAAGGLRTSTDR